MTLRTILTEQFEMAVIVGVARQTVERCFFTCDTGMRCGTVTEMSDQLFPQNVILTLFRFAVELPQPDCCQRFVIHFRWTLIDSLMF